MKDYKVKRIARQAGLTLIELTVVLLILIGLAGLMLPYVGGFVDKTHDSANSDSLVEVSKAIQRYDVQFMGQPSNFDSLVATTAGNFTDSTLYTHMMNSDDTGPAGYLEVVSVPGAAFTRVGISSLLSMNENATDKTFDAALAPVALPSTAIDLAALRVKGSACTPMEMGCIDSDVELAKILGRPVGSINTSGVHYVAFGVGQGSGMVGKTISEAPVHFAKTGAMSAANKYNRILAIYEVQYAGYCDGGVRADEFTPAADSAECETAGAVMTTPGTWRPLPDMVRAKFMTTVMPMMRLEGLGGALSNHYKNVDG